MRGKLSAKVRRQRVGKRETPRHRSPELKSEAKGRERGEEARPASDARLRAIFDAASSVGFVTTDLAGEEARIVDFSPGAERMFGYRADEVIGKPLALLHVPEDVARFPASIEALRRRKAELSGEVTLVRKSGATFPALLTLYPLYDEQGGLNAVLGVTVDIAERKQAEEELRESERKYRTLIENLPQKIFLKDTHSVYLSCNENYARDLGIEPGEIAGKTDYDFFPRELADKYRADDKRLAESGETVDVEEPYIQDGEETWVHTVKTPVRDESGNVVAVLGIFWDITERKRAEEGLRQARDVAQRYLDVAEVMLLACGDEGQVTLINKKGCSILGYSQEEIVGKNWFENFLPENIREGTQAVFDKLMGGEVEPVEYHENPVLTKSGEERLIAWHNTVLADERGRIVGTLSSAEDITEQRRLEKEVLEIGQKERQRIGQDLHDGLGQRLTGLAFMSKVLGDKLAARSLPEASKAREITRLVNEAISETRALARGLSPVPLGDGLISALSTLAVEVQELFGVSCHFRSDGDVAIRDNTVATQLYYIGQEAVNNAVKHAKASRVSIDLSLSNGRTTLEVTDDGVGLPEAPGNEGTGLHIMEYRARMIGASLAVRSRPGAGTTVTCSLQHSAGPPKEEERS